jgi:2-hydroxychromene-2-carboxylate isomerase
MARLLVTYFDYKSPYAFVAKNLIRELASECGVGLEWRPYTLHIPDFLGSAEVNERGERIADERTARQWRRVKYIYMDCRRLAAQRGLTFHPPRRVFESFVAHVGTLYARRRDAFQGYHDLVYERFWRRELDLDSVAEISQVLRSIGVDADDFAAFVQGEGRLEHDRIMDEAHALGVFGVPSFIVDGELYWGGEHLSMLRRRLARSNSIQEPRPALD